MDGEVGAAVEHGSLDFLDEHSLATHRVNRHVGVAIADVLTLLNPAAVILGGGFARLDELLVNPLREAVLRRAFVSSMSTADIRTGEIGPQAIAVGAATLVLESALQNPRLFPRPVASQVGR